MQKLDEKTLDDLRKKCKKSLFFLARAVLGFEDLTRVIHRPICKGLENYEINTRCMVVLPRTWFKSSIGSIAYPIWRAINNPNIRILIAQNSMTNAKKKISSIKSIFEGNELFRALFPDLLPRGDKPWSSECLTVNRKLPEPEGTFEPAGTGTAVTSRHYDLIIQDDTVAPDFDSMTGEMQQPTTMEIEKSIGFHKMCHPLLVHPTKAQILIIGTRWAPEDLIGWILKNAPGYKIFTRSALERPGHIGEPATEEQGGVPIWDRFNLDVLRELQDSVGIFMFHMLYLNVPSNSINQVFKRSYVSYYEDLPRGLIFCTSVDPAPTDSASKGMDPDYNVVLTTGVNPATGEIFVVHYNRDRVNPGELIDYIFDHYRAYHPVIVKVESVAYQKTLMYWITKRQEAIGERFYIEEVKNARTSKNARILGLQPWFAAKKVLFKVSHSDLERELLSFDPAKKGGTGHDDVIDALSMQIKFWSDTINTYRAEVEEDKVANPFSGKAIISELLDRVSDVRKYPNDIGNMGERAKARLPRLDYAYSDGYSLRN